METGTVMDQMYKETIEMFPKNLEKWNQQFPSGTFNDIPENLLKEWNTISNYVYFGALGDKDKAFNFPMTKIINEYIKSTNQKLYNIEIDDQTASILSVKLLVAFMWNDTLKTRGKNQTINNEIVFDHKWINSFDGKKAEDEIFQ